MNTQKKAEWKGMFKGVVVTLLLLGVFSAGAVYAGVTLMSDEGFFVNGNEVLVEQDFTSWSHKWTEPLPDGVFDPSYTGFLLDDTNDVLMISWWDGFAIGDHWNRFGVFNLEDFSQVYVSPSTQDYTAARPEIDWQEDMQFGAVGLYGGISKSVDTYILFGRHNNDNNPLVLEVWRGGATPVWSHNVTADNAEMATYGISHGAISDTGKWILVLGYNTSSTSVLMCYEGS